jgi:hypothetical protein
MHFLVVVVPPRPCCATCPRRTLLAKEQARIRQQYEERLRELESERQSVQEDKAQVRVVGWGGRHQMSV